MIDNNTYRYDSTKTHLYMYLEEIIKTRVVNIGVIQIDLIDDDVLVYNRTIYVPEFDISKIFQLAKTNGIIPYQNKDLLNNLINISIHPNRLYVRYEKQEDMIKFYISKMDYINKINNLPITTHTNLFKSAIDLPSDIDMFRMKRSIDSNYNYLIQLDKRQLDWLPTINDVCVLLSADDRQNIFVIMNSTQSAQTIIEDHKIINLNIDTKIDIYGITYFEQMLTKLVANKELTQLQSDKLNSDFVYVLGRYEILISKLLLHPLDYDQLIRQEQIKLYGLTKDNVKTYFEQFTNKLTIYDDNLYDQSYSAQNNCSRRSRSNLLSNSLELKSNQSKCYYNKLKIHELANLYKKQTLNINSCGIYPTSPDDIPGIVGCKFSDINIKFQCKSIKSILKSKYGYTKANINTDKVFDLNELYMPEWYDTIHAGKPLTSIYNVRQLLLGNLTMINYAKLCPLIIRSNPFINSITGLVGISWDIDINKMVLTCSLMSDLIFPVRFEILDKDIGEYFSVVDISNYIPIANIMTKAKGKRSGGKIVYFNSFVYFDKTASDNMPGQSIIVCNYRCNKILAGNLYEAYRILYIELNIVKYFPDDIGYPLYIYKYGESTYYISKYNKDEIRTAYSNLPSFNSIDIDELLGALTEIVLMKDNIDKKFKLEPK